MGKRGPPPLEPTKQMRASVLAMAGFGIPADEIARAMLHPVTGKPISETTLKKFFAYEYRPARHHETQGRGVPGADGDRDQRVDAAGGDGGDLPFEGALGLARSRLGRR